MQLKEKYSKNITNSDVIQMKNQKNKAKNNLFKASSQKKVKEQREISRLSTEVRNDYLHNMTINSSKYGNNSRIDVYQSQKGQIRGSNVQTAMSTV